MALRNPTDEETKFIIRASLGTVFVFRHHPDEPEFLEEVISWKDILNIPRVTQDFLFLHTLIATEFLFPGSEATMNHLLFFEHLDQTEEETVRQYRDFLKFLLTLEGH